MSSQNPVKGVFDGVCSIGKFFSPLYPYLPSLYTVITIIFMILGIVGVIMFAAGKKFKNLARTIYAFVYFITSFFNMLIIFIATYCSLIIPTGEKVAEVGPSSESNMLSAVSDRFNKHESTEGQMGGNKRYPIISNILAKIFDVINKIIENNNSPFIITQVLCTCLIVIATSFMSVIFSGISKAGYEMHCTEHGQVFSVPWLGKIIDFFMHLLLVISCIFVVLYSFVRLALNGISTITERFLPKKDSATKPNRLQELMKAVRLSDALQAINEGGVFMNEFPIVRAAFIISLSYYISQLILEMFQNIISNNIVLLTSWQKRETECSDEPKKESKVAMERGFILFCNIVLFIILCIISLGLVVVNLWFYPIINTGLGMVFKLYPNISAQIGAPLTFEGVLKTVKKVGKTAGVSVDVDGPLKQGETELKKIGLTGDEDPKDLVQKALESGISFQSQETSGFPGITSRRKRSGAGRKRQDASPISFHEDEQIHRPLAPETGQTPATGTDLTHQTSDLSQTPQTPDPSQTPPPDTPPQTAPAPPPDTPQTAPAPAPPPAPEPAPASDPP